MQRLPGVITIAVLSLVGSLVCLAMSCLMVVAFFVRPIQPNGDQLAKIGFMFTILLFSLPAAWGIVSSIGLFRGKSWARISTLVFSGLLAFFGVISPVFLLAIPFAQVPNVDAGVVSMIRLAMSVFYLGLAAIGIWWLVYLTRPKVKEHFMGGVVANTPSRRPLSISIIGWILVVSTCFIPFNLILRMPAVVLGFVVTGWLAALYLLLYGAVGLGGGIGMLRLKEYGRLLGMTYFIFGIANAIFCFGLPGAPERWAKMLDAMPPAFHTTQVPAIRPAFMFLPMIPVLLVPIYFLIRNKSAFEASSLPPSAPGVHAS
jgi:hypothetical protein